MAISRMQQPRQMYNQGGLGALDAPRQGYFLGKLVKKAGRAVKKIVKSPIGKMAILGGLGMYAGGLGPFSSMRGAGFLRGAGGNLISGLKSKEGFLGSVGNMFRQEGDPEKGFSMGRMLAGGLGATALAMPFLGGKEEVEEEEAQMDPAYQTQRAKDYYSQTGTKGVGLDFMPDKQYVKQNFYAADGGRAALQMGGGAGEAQAEQMLMAEFVKYKNKGGDLSFEQFVQAVMQQQDQSQGMEQPTMMAADGGRAGYANGQLVTPSGDGSRPGYAGPLDFFKNLKSGFNQIIGGETSAFLGGDQEKINEILTKKGYGIDLEPDVIEMIINMNKQGSDIDTISSITGADKNSVSGVIDMLNMNIEQPVEQKADGGIAGMSVPGYGTPAGTNQFGYPSGGVRVNAAEGGIMNTDEASEMIDMGGMEKDYRNEGGFVAMGGEERADDVPARLSRNEFVFTADAVRQAGGGNIDRGSEVMQNLMDNLEQGGQVSEDSQGLGGGEEMMSEEIIEEPNGAQAMYEQQQALQSRMA